jgi:hypothetical protein
VLHRLPDEAVHLRQPAVVAQEVAEAVVRPRPPRQHPRRSPQRYHGIQAMRARGERSPRLEAGALRHP